MIHPPTLGTCDNIWQQIPKGKTDINATCTGPRNGVWARKSFCKRGQESTAKNW